MSHTLSVVVAVYNVEDYLEKCLDSIVSQSYKDLDIVLVNDGSKDSSGLICEKFANMDHRIRVINKDNGGLSSARNVGIQAAQGDLIAFVDSDDYVELNCYETLSSKLEENDYDMVVCNLYYQYDKKKVVSYSNVLDDVYGKKKVKRSMLNIYPVAWNKIFKNMSIKGLACKI